MVSRFPRLHSALQWCASGRGPSPSAWRPTQLCGPASAPPAADEPRTLEIFSRIYSPCALGTSIDFGHRYHCRARICGDEYHAEANVEYRRAGACRQDEPQYASAPAEVYGKRKGNVLFRVCMMDSGKEPGHAVCSGKLPTVMFPVC